MALNKGKVITVTSVKGGVGKTINLLNIAGVLAQQRKKVLIIDLDLYTGNIDLLLNLKSKKNIFNLVDDITSKRFNQFEEYITAYDQFIDVLPSPKDPRDAVKIEAKYISLVISKAVLKYDIILIDTNHAMDEEKLIILDNSDSVLYFINNDICDLTNMRTINSIYTAMDKKNYITILNDSNNRKNYFTKYDIKHMVNGTIDYIIPSSFYIKNIESYLLDGKILTLDKKIQFSNKKVMTTYKKIVNKLIEI